MSDSWRSRADRQARVARSVESMARGSLKGRIVEAAPVRPRPKQSQDPEDDAFVWVDTQEPPDGEAPQGKLWFKTDEPV